MCFKREVWFWQSLLARCRPRPNVGMVRQSGGSASVMPSLSMCPGRCWILFDVDVVRVWGTCRGSSPGGAEPHQLRGLMSGGRPPVGSRCGITGMRAEPCGPRQRAVPCLAIWAEPRLRFGRRGWPNQEGRRRIVWAWPSPGNRSWLVRCSVWFGAILAEPCGGSVDGVPALPDGSVRLVCFGRTSREVRRSFVLQVSEDGAWTVRGWS